MKRMTLPLALVVFAGCGDPVLPSDYAGPPASAVSGNVEGLAGLVRDAERPRMSLEWLDFATDSLIGQPLSFKRSVKLQHDWDIGLALPMEGAKFELAVDAGAGSGARVGVGKIVYFDDRQKIDRIDWTCLGAGCNRVLAVSDQYVLYVDQPSYCQEAGKTGFRPRIGAGYHYFSFDPGSGVRRELDSSESVSFSIADRAPADSSPSAALQAFTNALERTWHVGQNGGCD
jgi:hypothetical protein